MYIIHCLLQTPAVLSAKTAARSAHGCRSRECCWQLHRHTDRTASTAPGLGLARERSVSSTNDRAATRRARARGSRRAAAPRRNCTSETAATTRSGRRARGGATRGARARGCWRPRARAAGESTACESTTDESTTDESTSWSDDDDGGQALRAWNRREVRSEENGQLDARGACVCGAGEGARVCGTGATVGAWAWACARAHRHAT